MTEEEAQAEREWHLDKKVPIALIFTIVLQTVTVVWWAATTSQRLDQVERRQEASASQAERIIRLEEKIGVVQQGIGEIKTMIRPSGR